MESWLSMGRQISDKFENLDGRVNFAVNGSFLGGGGVSTLLTLHYEESQPDGSYKKVRFVKTVSEPGEYSIASRTGKYWFSASGPERMPWRVHVVVS